MQQFYPLILKIVSEISAQDVLDVCVDFVNETIEPMIVLEDFLR